MLISKQENKELYKLFTVIIRVNKENDIDTFILNDSEYPINEK